LTLSFGFAQTENPLTNCTSPIPFYVGLNSGVNLSKVNYDEHTSSFNTSYQLGLEIESLFPPFKNGKSSLLYGLSYESKIYEINNDNNEAKNINADYLTFPIKYQYRFSNYLNIHVGGFYSFLLNSNDDNYLSAFPNSNYGISLGINSIYVFRNGVNLILEYSFQNGFAPIDNTTQFSSNISHVINIGFKVPSTSIF
jgi:hypothetical protein